MSLQVGQPAPDFTATAVVGREFKEIRMSDYRGRYVVLFFYPLDFRLSARRRSSASTTSWRSSSTAVRR